MLFNQRVGCLLYSMTRIVEAKMINEYNIPFQIVDFFLLSNLLFRPTKTEIKMNLGIFLYFLNSIDCRF